MLGQRKRQRHLNSKSLPRPRLHGTANRIAHKQLAFAYCTTYDAVMAAAKGVAWLIEGEHPGAIIIADHSGKFITMVWNRAGFERWADNQPTGVTYGDLVLQPDVPAGPVQESIRLIVEIPE